MSLEQENNNYKLFLDELMIMLDKLFIYQQEYLCCQNGCSLCCEDGMYPFSKMEFNYIMLAYKNLPNDMQTIIKNKVQELKKEYHSENFFYECPFLINKSCSVYDNRGLICRTFGLITEDDSKKLTVPFCAENGLNYSKVYNKATKRLDEELVRKYGYSVDPKAYNLSRRNIMYGLSDDLGFDWGETKLLIDWLFQYFEMDNL